MTDKKVVRWIKKSKCGKARKKSKSVITLSNFKLSPDEYIKFMSQYTEFLNNPVRNKKIKGKFII